MSSATDTGLIGPNAILQLLLVIERLGGEKRVGELLSNAGLQDIPDGSAMIPEVDAARVHQQLRIEEPERASRLVAEAGRLTGDYILSHRIPRMAQALLKMLPASIAARLLSKAITRHAWTFAGSGTFEAIDAWTFKIRNNPIIRGEHSESCLCDWHAAVFQRLYAEVVHPECRCVETSCGAQVGSDCCRFEIERRNSKY